MSVDDVDRAAIYADLGGLAEISAALGVSMYRLRRWIERRETTNCPLPVRELRTGYVYSVNDWQGWFAVWKVTRGSETWQRTPPFMARRLAFKPRRFKKL